jgi:hypothetical protein
MSNTSAASFLANPYVKDEDGKMNPTLKIDMRTEANRQVFLGWFNNQETKSIKLRALFLVCG